MQRSNFIVRCLELGQSGQIGEVFKLGDKIVVEFESLEKDQLSTLEATEFLYFVLAKVQVLEALFLVSGFPQALPEGH